MLLFPGSSWRYKSWPEKRFARLAERIRRELDCEPVVVCGPGEEGTGAAVAAAAGIPLGVVRPADLTALYRIIADATAVVCNNSAPLHLAEAIGTPVIVLTGSSDPVRWGPYSPTGVGLCHSVGLPCHPCREQRCVTPDSPCITRIAVGEVVDALQTLIPRAEHGRSQVAAASGAASR